MWRGCYLFAYTSEAVSVLEVNSVESPGKEAVEAELITLFYDIVTSGDLNILSELSTAGSSDSYISSNFILDSEGLTFGFRGSDYKRKITKRELSKVVQEYTLPKQKVSGTLYVIGESLIVNVSKVNVDLYGLVDNTVKFEGQRNGNAVFTVIGENILTGNKKTITVKVDTVIGDKDYYDIVSIVLQDLGGLLFEKASYAIESNAGVAWVVENSIISDYLGVNDGNIFDEALGDISIEKEFVFSISSDGYNANAKLRYGDADTLGVGIENGTTNFVDGKYLYRTKGNDFLDRFGEGGLVTVDFDFLGKTGEEAIKELSLYADESNSLVSIVRGTSSLNEETYKEVLNSLSRIGAINSNSTQPINEGETSGWFSNGTLATALRRFVKVQEMLGETGTYSVGSRLEGDVVTHYIKKD